MKHHKNWWQKIFNENYLKTYVDLITPQRTEKEVNFLLKFIKEKFKNKKIKILDLACGYGRHSLPLAKLGYYIVGVDYSNYFLKLARKEANKLKLKNVKFIKKDMRKIKFKEKFDLVINMFTSFGYFENENDNLLVLKNVYQSLKNNGYFIMDLTSHYWWFRLLLEKGRFNNGLLEFSSTVKQSNNLEVTTKIGIDIFKMRAILKKEWFEDKPRNYEGSFRLYSLEEICNYLRLLNFKILKVYGNFNKSKFDFSSPRMIIIAQK